MQPNAAKSHAYNHFLALLDEVTEVKELSEPILKKLIDHIEIEQGYYQKDENGKKRKHQNIKVYYKFIGLF